MKKEVGYCNYHDFKFIEKYNKLSYQNYFCLIEGNTFYLISEEEKWAGKFHSFFRINLMEWEKTAHFPSGSPRPPGRPAGGRVEASPFSSRKWLFWKDRTPSCRSRLSWADRPLRSTPR